MSLYHFLGECRELRELRFEIFGREVRVRDCISEIFRNKCHLNINNVGKFVWVGMKYRDDFRK